jgi:hypothetical protein
VLTILGIALVTDFESQSTLWEIALGSIFEVIWIVRPLPIPTLVHLRAIPKYRHPFESQFPGPKLKITSRAIASCGRTGLRNRIVNVLPGRGLNLQVTFRRDGAASTAVPIFVTAQILNETTPFTMIGRKRAVPSPSTYRCAEDVTVGFCEPDD